MSWMDIFFPSERRKEEEIARLSGKLSVLVDNCFLTTNKIIDCIQQYLPRRKYDELELDSSKSIRDSCNLIIQRLDELDRYLEETKLNIEKEMNPEVFRKLVSPGTSYLEKLKIAKSCSTHIMDITGSVEGIVLCGVINSGNIFTNITRALHVVKNSAIGNISLQNLSVGLCKTTSVIQEPLNDYDLAVAGVVLYGAIFAVHVCARVTNILADPQSHAVTTSFVGVVAVGLYVYASSIVKRTTEKGRLETFFNDFQRVVQELQPAIDELYDNISVLRARIELTV
ncbi:hypothetical protein ACJMK2_000512 [Sinanodonta woodiana]|uniref:Uncharacterized protein n=1 Tax=Sinanodonta woodiana TaxID=1069815 RepID=A0ABD3XQ01_SINWO